MSTAHVLEEVSKGGDWCDRGVCNTASHANTTPNLGTVGCDRGVCNTASHANTTPNLGTVG